jgi:hypothetical protein
MTARLLALSALLGMLVGCASTPQQPIRIDGSTPDAFRTSWSTLNSSLSAEQQAQLNTAVLLLGATKLHDSGFKGPSSFGPETLRGDLNGKTFEEIIAAAKGTGATVTVNSH